MERRIEKRTPKRKGLGCAPIALLATVAAFGVGYAVLGDNKYPVRPTRIENCDNGDRNAGQNVPEVGYITIAPEKRMGALALMYKAAVTLRTDMNADLETRDPGNQYDLYATPDQINDPYKAAAKDFFIKQDGGYNLFDTRANSNIAPLLSTTGNMPDNRLDSGHEVLCIDDDGYHFTEAASEALIDLGDAGVAFKSAPSITESVQMLAATS